jgi:hypothetical protein
MWILPTSIRSAYAQALGCSTSALTPDLDTWATAAATACTLSGRHTRAPQWRLAWKKAPWLQRLSGLAISPAFPPPHFAAWWTSSLQASRARISAWPGDAPASTASAVASSSTSSTPPTLAVREASFWRTSTPSLLPPPPLWTRRKASSTSARSPASWENWPTAGGMRNGALFQRPTWAPATAAPDGSALLGGAWMTPHGMAGQEAETGRPGAGGEFAKQASQWMTPTAMAVKSVDYQRQANGKDVQILRGQAKDLMDSRWPTPTAASDQGPDSSNREGGPTLVSSASAWPTPTAALMNDGEDPVQWQARADRLKLKGTNGNGAGMPLTVAAASWPTPASRDYRSPNLKSYDSRGGGAKGEQLQNFVAHHFSPLALAAANGLPSSSTAPGSPQPSASKNSMTPRLLQRRLNPYFGELLMGWLPGWTSPLEHSGCDASAMASFHCRLRSRLSSVLGEPDSSLPT